MAVQKTSEVDWENWIPAERATLLFILEGNRILLIHKKRGFGAGYYNAPGGRMEEGETPLECAVRETQEELCITPVNPVHAGTLMFQFTDGFSIHGEVFSARTFTGVPTETEEAVPHWFDIDTLPWHNMWADDPVWYPKLIAGEKFIGRFIFEKKTMLDYELLEHPDGYGSADNQN